MHLWTDGGVHVVATGRGVAWTGDGGAALHRFELGPVRRGEEPRDVDALVPAAPAGARVLVVRKGAVTALERDGERIGVEPVEAPLVQAIAALDAGRFLVAHEVAAAPGAPARTELASASLEGGSLRLVAPVALPAPKRIAWPEGVVWEKGRAPWPEDDDDPDEDNPFDAGVLGTGLADRVWISTSAHGVVVTGNYAGTVALLDPETLEARWCVRMPTQDDAALHAVATRAGVLVALVVGGRESAIFLLDGATGARVAHRAKLGRDAAYGLSAPVLLDEERVLLTDEKSAWTIALPDLDATRVKVPESGKAVLAHAVLPGRPGALVAVGAPLAAPHLATLGVLTGPKAEDLTKVVMPDLRPPEKAVARVLGGGPARRKGAASLGLNARGVRWRVGVGAELAIDLVAVNQGGEAKGMFIELGGPAVAGGLVVPSRARIGDVEAPFVARGPSFRADLPSARLDAAFEPPPATKQLVHREPPAPPPRIDVAIALAGAKVGDGLLTIRLGALASGTSGSALQGRNVEVVPASAG